MKRLLISFMFVLLTAASVSAQTAYAIWCQGDSTLYFDYVSTSIQVGSSYNGQTVTTVYSGDQVLNSPTKPAWSEKPVRRVVIQPAFKNCHPTSMESWFNSYSYYSAMSITEIIGLNNLSTDQTISMEKMFYFCRALTSLDLSGFDTSKVTDMEDMFSYCRALTSLDLSGFDTSKVTDMEDMFRSCSSLTSLDLSIFDTSNVKYMLYMFYGCDKLTSLDLSNFNTSKVEDMEYMFRGCSSLTSLDLSSFNTSNVEYMSYMFEGCENLKTIYCNSTWTAIIDDGYYMFNGCSSLKGAISYDPEKTDVNYANPKNGYFTIPPKAYAILCGDIRTLYFDYTSENISVGSTYDGHTITELWSGDQVLNSGEAPKWVQSKSNVDKVEFRPGFKSCHPTSTACWFYRERSDEEVSEIKGLEYLNTNKVTNMRGMFRWTFVKELDLSNFKTSNVRDMYAMFDQCSSLKTIYAKNWDISKVTNSNDMFNNCTSLEGGAGTTYSSSHRDASYAHIDGGTSNPGYFTVKKNSGDVNEDTKVDINDVVAIINTMAGTASWPNANVNGDSKVDINDVVAVINIMAGK